MRKYYFLLASLLLTQGAMAIDYTSLLSNGKLTAVSKIELSQLQELEENAITQSKATGNRLKAIRQQMDSRSLRALIQMTPGSDASILANEGISLTTVVDHFAIADLSLSDLETLAERSDIERISFGKRKKHLLLNKAHGFTGVDKIHQGSNLTQPYTGKGVAIGILDDGFDPNHIMFQDATGKSRFKMIAYAKSDGADLTYLTTPSTIASYQTDDTEEYHATHVCGIAAGNYQGAQYQLQGVAPEADLLMGPIPYYESDYDVFAKMAEWCQQNQGKRLVVNMSYGMNAGCHDATDPEAALMDQIIKKYDIVACISAGNEADYSVVQRHTFTGETGETMQAAYYIYDTSDGVQDYFTVSDQQQIELDFVVVNTSTGKIARQWKFVNANYPNGRNQKYNNSDLTASVSVQGETIGNGMKGYYLDISNIDIKKDNLALGYVIRAKAGQTITSYLESLNDFDVELDGWNADITSDGTINSIACGTEPIVVGSFNTTASYQALDGRTYRAETTYGKNVNEISYFSSYGKLVDGRELPTICAPGLFIESSANHYANIPDDEATHQENVNGYSYKFSAMSGTSMASPYMAGVCALWLEADPTLTHTQIRNIAQNTASVDSYCLDDNYYTKYGDGNQAGGGKVDAYAGLKYILDQKTAILSPIADGKDMMIRSLDGIHYEAYIAGATSMQASLYTMEGRQVASAKKAGNTVSISAEGQPSGVYILRISDGKQVKSRKVVVN